MQANDDQHLETEGPFQDLHLYPGVSMCGGDDNVRYNGSQNVKSCYSFIKVDGISGQKFY